MKRFIATSGLALILASGLTIAAVAQAVDPITGEEGTVVTAEQLDNAALDNVEEVRVVDVEALQASPRAEALRDAMEDSDPAAIRDYLEQDSEVAERIRGALSEAQVSEEEVVALVLHEDNRLVVLYRRGT